MSEFNAGGERRGIFVKLVECCCLPELVRVRFDDPKTNEVRSRVSKLMDALLEVAIAAARA